MSAMKQLFAAILLFLLSTSTAAFSPEMLIQVVGQLGGGAGQIQLDELAFAAANYISDNSPLGQQSQRNVIMPVLRRLGRNDSGSDMSKILARVRAARRRRRIQKPSSIYDYESTQTISGLLDLTPEEDMLINLLKKVRDKYSPNTTIRIAGGWVRDKLLYGKDTPSRDVDLVLSDRSGKEFAEALCKYVNETSGEGGVTVQVQQLSSSKGAQAGHLETASLLISGFEVDFCRLRYEKYKNKESRIPSNIGVASVVEDAWRRDLTINSLYYNINTNQVEDWTERGITDLVMQTISTPKDPLKTLLEDPLRILRAIRFAAQLSFDMNPVLVRAARDERVQTALQYKVSRDAIGSSIDQMLGTRARDPSRAIRLLMATNLINLVFPLERQEDDGNNSVPPFEAKVLYQVGLACLSRTQSLVTRIFLQSDFEWDISKRRFLWYAALFKPVYELASTRIGSSSKRGRRQDSILYQLLESLRRPKKDIQSIESILRGVDPIQAMLLEEAKYSKAIQSAIQTRSTPEDSGLSDIRWSLYCTLKPIGTMWKEALILALASSAKKSLTDCVDEYKDLVLLVEDELRLGPLLLDKSKLKPLLDGSQIKCVLGQIDGPGFKLVMQVLEEWQIRNDCYDVEGIGNEERNEIERDLIDYLTTRFPEYQIAQA